MRIDLESPVRHPRSLVYATYRDDLPTVAAHIPDVEAIVERAREERPPGPRIHNEWISRSEVPLFLRPFVSAEMLRWDDYAQWHDADHSGSFDVKLRFFTDHVTWRGWNRFLAPTPSTTVVRVEGTIDVDVARIPGVPRMLVGTLKPRIERYVATVMGQNLHQMNASIERYLTRAA